MPLTAAELLAWITAALLLQIGAGTAYALWAYRRDSRAAAARDAALPAARPAASDAAWPGWRNFRVARRELEDADGSQCSFHLEPVDGRPLPPFQPGQYLTFSLDIVGAPAPVTRCYSLSDRPEPTHYRITVKRVPAAPGPDGQAAWPPGLSSNHFHDHVHAGSVLRVRAPSGRFHIDAQASAAPTVPAVPTVLVAGGIGITPMMSMLRWSLAQQPQRPLVLYYGLRHGGEHAFRATLQALAAAHPQMQLHVAYSRPSAADVAGSDYQHLGRVDIDLLRRTLPHGRHQFYVCGPTAMMESLVPALAAWGVARGDLHFEAFGPASVRWPGDAAPAADQAAATGPTEVRFQRSGRTLTWQASDGTLLDFAEKNGIAVESGCRTGGCGSCQTRVLEGEIRYEHAPDHAIAAGCGLLCVGRPASNLVLEA